MIIQKKSEISESARVSQLRGIFDLDDQKTSISEIKHALNLESVGDEWNIGVIVGASGSGKTTLAKEMFPVVVDDLFFEWSPNKSVVDDFPIDMSIKDITQLLSSVGFSSPPSWLRSYYNLSNGEQFRVRLAQGR